MRVRLEAPQRLPFWLIGDPTLNDRTEQSQALQDTFRITRNIQDQQGAGFPTRAFYERGNQKVELEANCRREFASAIARMDFMTSLALIEQNAQAHAWEGDVWIRENGEGTSYKEWRMPDAAVMLAGTKLDGEVSVVLTYRIQAGGFDRSRTGGVNIEWLWAYQSIEAAHLILTTGQIDGAVAGLDPEGYPGSYFEIISTGANPEDIIIERFIISSAGYPVGLETPISDHLAEIAADYTAAGGILTVFDPGGGPEMDLAAGFVGPESWVQWNFYRAGLTGPPDELVTSYEAFGGGGDQIFFTGNDDTALTADVG